MSNIVIEPFIRFDLPKVKLSPEDEDRMFEQLAGMIGKIRCPICKLYFYDLQVHCKDMDDGDHLVLLVHNV
jgi:hypothetical protein